MRNGSSVERNVHKIVKMWAKHKCARLRASSGAAVRRASSSAAVPRVIVSDRPNAETTVRRLPSYTFHLLLLLMTLD